MGESNSGMTDVQGEMIIDRLDDLLAYMDAMNQLFVSVQNYTMLLFFLVSVVGGVYIGYSIWGKR